MQRVPRCKQIQEQHRTNTGQFTPLKYKPQPWQPSDSLAIAGRMYQTLTNQWEDEIDRAQVTARAGAIQPKTVAVRRWIRGGRPGSTGRWSAAQRKRPRR
jgi:acyl-homoserine lactone acylase PvdQ